MRPFACLLLMLAVACGTRSGPTASARCAPLQLDSSWTARGPVYRSCEVDRAAEETFRPRLSRVDGLGSQTCHAVLIEFVVDTTGLVEPGTARVVRGNSRVLELAVMNELERSRFRPAMRNGTRVRQVTRQEHAISSQVVQVRVTGSGAYSAPSAPPAPPCRA